MRIIKINERNFFLVLLLNKIANGNKKIVMIIKLKVKKPDIFKNCIISVAQEKL